MYVEFEIKIWIPEVILFFPHFVIVARSRQIKVLFG